MPAVTEIINGLRNEGRPSCSLSATYPTIGQPEPESLQRFFGFRLRLREITEFAADRMVCVDR